MAGNKTLELSIKNVSFTHLTLPTVYSVVIAVGCAFMYKKKVMHVDS